LLQNIGMGIKLVIETSLYEYISSTPQRFELHQVRALTQINIQSFVTSYYLSDQNKVLHYWATIYTRYLLGIVREVSKCRHT